MIASQSPRWYYTTENYNEFINNHYHFIDDDDEEKKFLIGFVYLTVMSLNKIQFLEIINVLNICQIEM